MATDIAVPAEAPTICEALRLAEQRGLDDVVVRLEPGFREPREAWPLEVVAWAPLRRLQVVGPPDRDATIHDVTLEAAGSADGGPSVVLRSLVLCGSVSLNGLGCALQDCDVRRGAEVGPAGAAAIRGCAVRAKRIGIAVHGPVVLERNEVEGCHIAVCLYGNPLAVLSGNRLLRCSAAAVMLTCSLAAEIGASTTLALTLDSTNTMEACARDVEVHVEVDGAAPLVLSEWPLPLKAIHPAPRRRGGDVDVELADGKTLRVIGVQGAGCTPQPGKKRRRGREPRAGLGAVAAAPAGSGPAWAWELLGLAEAGAGGGPVTAKQLQSAYRRKAREVHPDKQPCQPRPRSEAHQRDGERGTSGGGGAADRVPAGNSIGGDVGGGANSCSPATAARFHELTVAYETLLSSFKPANSGGDT